MSLNTLEEIASYIVSEGKGILLKYLMTFLSPIF